MSWTEFVLNLAGLALFLWLMLGRGDIMRNRRL